MGKSERKEYGKMNLKENKIISAIRSDFVAKLFSSWFFMGSILFLLSSGNTINADLFQSVNLFVAIALFVVLFAAQTAIANFTESKKVIPIFVLMSVSLLSVEAAMKVTDKFVILGFAAAVFLAARYAYLNGLEIGITKKCTGIVVACVALGFTVFVCTVMVLRIKIYTAPNFDFGIFCNIFYNLKESFQPLATCERDKLLSHFAVHFSPILYLLLPIYYLFPYAETLNIAQVIILFSGIVPLLLIMKKYKLGNAVTMFLSLAFFAYPAISYGCIYDFHENCFILPLLLWMFYFYEKNKKIPMFVFAFLVLMVKEEAFAYVFIFALYIMLARKDYKKGAALMAMSLIYFGLAVLYISHLGEGIMSNRFANLKQADEGLLGVVKTVFKTPVLVINELFRSSASDSGKLIYIIQLFVPLAMLPFMSKKFSRLILICPLLINLLSDYYYQCDLGKQYSFGITAFLFYAAVINLSDIKERKGGFLAFSAAIVSVVMMVSLMYPRLTGYALTYRVSKENYERITEVLEEIPDDASVTASTFFVPKLSQRKVIYEQYYHKTVDTDYLVLDLRGSNSTKIAEIEQPYINAGYKMIVNDEGLIRVYEKN